MQGFAVMATTVYLRTKEFPAMVEAEFGLRVCERKIFYWKKKKPIRTPCSYEEFKKWARACIERERK